MKSHRYTALLLGLLVLSCANVQSKTDRLQRSVFELNEGLRWNRSQEVFSRVHPESAEHIAEVHQDFGKEIQVSGYEIVQTRLHSENSKAEITIKFVWYKQSELIVHESIFVQHWEHIERDWLLVSEEFVSGVPF